MVRCYANEKYYKSLKVLLKECPELEEEIDRRIRWFSKNPNDTRLDNHELKKKMQGQNAFSITGDVRIVYKWIGKKEVRFLIIGPHPVVYGNGLKRKSFGNRE